MKGRDNQTVNTNMDAMEEEKVHPHHFHGQQDDTETAFSDRSDICQQLLDRYSKSSAPQHRHLCATAAATRSIIQSESLPLTPLSYFAATIANIAETSTALDANAVSALSSFMAIVLPLVPENAIAPTKAADAAGVLVELLKRPSDAVTTSSVRALVKCLGVLVQFCDMENWDSVKLGFQSLLKFSIDKRPKVRKCSQDCLLEVFKSFESSAVTKKASKMVLSVLKNHMASAATIGALGAADVSIDVVLSKEYLEVLHMLNVLKLIFPHLSVKIRIKMLSELQKLMTSQLSALTRHIFDIIGVAFQSFNVEVTFPEIENIIRSLVAYASLGENPSDTILSAAKLSKNAIDRLHTGGGILWISYFPLVFRSVAGLLTYEASIALQASNILKDLIKFVDVRDLVTGKEQVVNNGDACCMEVKAIKSACDVFDDFLSNCSGIPNEHFFASLSALFLKVGECSYTYMKGILLKLADLMDSATKDSPGVKYLQECIGSAVIAMGPEKLLTLFPISLNAQDLSSSNIWLLPILKNYVIGSSLGFFMAHMVPLAESFQQASCKDLQAHANSCWGLLPAFCRHPTDIRQNFGPLTKLLISILKTDSFVLEHIATALQELVNQNKSVLGNAPGSGQIPKLPSCGRVNEILREFDDKFSYSKKAARRNIKSLTACSEELIQTLIDVFFESPPDKHTILKETITCLASITDSSVTQKIFVLELKRLELVDDTTECGEMGSDADTSEDNTQKISTFVEKNAKRKLVLELASSFVEGANEDLIDLMFSFIKHTLQDTEQMDHCEAYFILGRIMEEHSWFCSSRLVELMDVLHGLKPPVDVTSLGKRLACFKTLLIHALKRSSVEDNTEAFLILNEIIIALKDTKDEVRKVAYDILLGVSSGLCNSSETNLSGPFNTLISMIMGYLTGSSPHIKSGAVSALSLLIYSNIGICTSIPDLVPSVLALLQSKGVEVIKAALGFVKVLVSCLQANDLQNYLSDVLTGVLAWSATSRHHFRSKVTVILEIMIRKCGFETIKLFTPDKYMDFVKSILVSRHGKASSKVAAASSSDHKHYDSYPQGHQKRKHKESHHLLHDDVSTENRKRNREQELTGKNPASIDRVDGLKRAKKLRHFGHRKRENAAQDIKKDKRKTFNGDMLGGKKHMEPTKVSKKTKLDGHRTIATSKFPKPKNIGKKRQRKM